MTKETLLKFREIYKKRGDKENLAKVEKTLKNLGVDFSDKPIHTEVKEVKEEHYSNSYKDKRGK